MAKSKKSFGAVVMEEIEETLGNYIEDIVDTVVNSYKVEEALDTFVRGLVTLRVNANKEKK